MLFWCQVQPQLIEWPVWVLGMESAMRCKVQLTNVLAIGGTGSVLLSVDPELAWTWLLGLGVYTKKGGQV